MKFKQIQYTALIQLLFSLAASEPAPSGQEKAFHDRCCPGSPRDLCEAGKGDFLSIDLQLLIVGLRFKAELAGPVIYYMCELWLWVFPNGHLVPVGIKGKG